MTLMLQPRVAATGQQQQDQNIWRVKLSLLMMLPPQQQQQQLMKLIAWMQLHRRLKPHQLL
jgi:hypothetical protein